MLDRWKFLICGASAYLIQTFILPYILLPLQQGFDTILQGIYYQIYYHEVGGSSYVYIIDYVVFYIFPVTALFAVSAFVFMRWKRLRPSLKTTIVTAVYFLATYAICTVILWVVLFALYSDSAMTTLQWKIVGTIDGIQNVDGYALQYLISWVLYLLPFAAGPLIAAWFLARSARIAQT